MSTIEIKREYGELDTIVFSFRYILLSENQKNDIIAELRTTNVVIESYSSEVNNHIVKMDLNESIDPKIIEELNERLGIPKANYGVWVSLTTYYDHSGLSFPNHVVDFIRIVGGQVDVSTIMISKEE